MNNQPQKNTNKPVLGKGLASLLPQAATSPTTQANPAIPAQGAEAEGMPNKDRHPGIMMCLLEDIVPNTFQPRLQFDDSTIEELAQSIKENGLIQPLIVRKAQKGFQLIAGERRLRAAKLAGLKQVPIVIRRTTDQEALELALIENIQREDLNCIDTALAYQQLAQQFNMTQEVISTRVGKDRATVANHLRLLKLPSKVVEWLKQGTLTYGHGKALAGIDSEEQILSFAEQIVDQRWSVRELERRIAELKDDASSQEEPKKDDPIAQRLNVVGAELSKKLSTKVKFKGNGSKGKIVIDYYSDADLNRLIETLHKATGSI